MADLGEDEAAEPGEQDAEDLRTRMKSYERKLLVDALEAHQGRIGETAEALGISRKRLCEQMRKYAVDAAAVSRS